MVNQYYQLMGWDEKTGKPLRKTLKRFGLDDVAGDLWG
jgi:aldehyde:ferredoxin oxidoreductase